MSTVGSVSSGGRSIGTPTRLRDVVEVGGGAFAHLGRPPQRPGPRACASNPAMFRRDSRAASDCSSVRTDEHRLRAK